MKVKDLEKREDLQFVDRDIDVADIKEHLGKDANDYNAFFVKVKYGEYEEVYGIENNIPYLNEEVYTLRKPMRTQKQLNPLVKSGEYIHLHGHDIPLYKRKYEIRRKRSLKGSGKQASWG